MTQAPGVGDQLIIRRAARFGLREFSPLRKHSSGAFYSKPESRLRPCRPFGSRGSHFSEKFLSGNFFTKNRISAMAMTIGRARTKGRVDKATKERREKGGKHLRKPLKRLESRKERPF
ncbi:MAG: hypothetical protein WB715_19835 [Roseiarcus sp.]|uniref:hypothetical protein n=1 Tax=Roseiarcus sp. TaxID=1969460 RepID=UPI003C3FA767